MNKYIIPISDTYLSSVWVKTITAHSIEDCEDKIIDYVVNKYELDNLANLSYTDFIEEAKKEGLLIGKILDIDEL